MDKSFTDFAILSNEIRDLSESGSHTALDQFLDRLHTQMEPASRLFTNYRCAAMEVETKFRVLNERFSMQYDGNPIESIKTRIKSFDSIIRKLERRNNPMTLESIEENIYDIAGVRVICSFVDDIYMLADCLLSQDDITLIEKKDYIKNPKESGYRSLHLIVQVPVFLETEKKMMYVEVQLRTIAMDFWASLEHKLRYKKDMSALDADVIAAELQECADISSQLDERMQEIRNEIFAHKHPGDTDASVSAASDEDCAEGGNNT